MSKLRKSSRIASVIAVTGIAALVLSGCSRATPSPGITDTTLSLGISSPLSGATAGPGSCTVAGLDMYLKTQNAAGGFKFGDGKTRQVNLTALDDVYDPAKAVANFKQLVNDGMFAYVGALGTPTNSAIMPIANEQKVPQVLLVTGASKFSSDQKANPETLGLLPTYYDEGYSFGKLMAGANKPLTAAVLSQNDDYGKDYVNGFTDAIKGSQVTIAGSATYEPTDTTLDSQVTKLAATKANALVSAVSVTPLQVGVLTKAQSLGWLPSIFLPSNTNTPATILVPGKADAYPGIYSTSLSKSNTAPATLNDPDVVAFNKAYTTYGQATAKVITPHCAWSYAEGAILEQAFSKMTEPTRDSFMKALKSIKDYQAPMLLPGSVVNTTFDTKPAIQGLTMVKFNGTGYSPATTF
jgi:branched-chain amino acid transport system substrate-binding protein